MWSLWSSITSGWGDGQLVGLAIKRLGIENWIWIGWCEIGKTYSVFCRGVHLNFLVQNRWEVKISTQRG